MAVPSELSVEAIRDFMLENGGKVTNHDLVKHFKPFLTNPETRVEARNQFKEYVNTVATIRNEEGEKYLILKKKYRNQIGAVSPTTSLASPGPSLDSLSSMSPTSMALSTYPASEDSMEASSPSRAPPPYRAPPPPLPSPQRQNPPLPETESVMQSPTQETEPPEEISERDSSRDDSMSSMTEETVIHAPPPVPPRRKSSDKLRLENKENVSDTTVKRPKTIGAEAGNKMEPTEVDNDQKISVKERMQKFNRLAESDMKIHAMNSKKRPDRGVDDDDAASVTTLDAKSREWLVLSSQADYQALAKLATDNPRLARFKDPTSYPTPQVFEAVHLLYCHI
ncbi:ankyrin repeat domain-containing protein SOWAHA-like [Periplaneta americana]|uniref:ankyrin repeat domain-containing protein SOWAHA-like n=1 Tax=Periplaneta americana TaxID=6978 RepID=UPI0037E98DF8